MNKCSGIFGAIFGHRYKARYSYGKPMVFDNIKSGNADGVARILQASKDATYEGDICERCGHKIDKESK